MMASAATLDIEVREMMSFSGLQDLSLKISFFKKRPSQSVYSQTQHSGQGITRRKEVFRPSLHDDISVGTLDLKALG